MSEQLILDDVEEWRVIDGFDAYEVSSFGRVRKGSKEIKNVKVNDRHVVIFYQNGTRKQQYVHRLVAEVFLSPPSMPEAIIKHIDQNKYNNHVSNLAWVLAVRKKHNPKNQKFSAEQIVSIRKDILAGESYEAIAQKNDTTTNSIYHIAKGNTGAYADDLRFEVSEYLKNKKRKSRYNVTDKSFVDWVVSIRKDILAGLSSPQVAKKYNVSPNQISRIRLGRLFSDVVELRDEVAAYVLYAQRERLRKQNRDSFIRTRNEELQAAILEVEAAIEAPLRHDNCHMFNGKPLETIRHRTLDGSVVSLPRLKFLEARV